MHFGKITYGVDERGEVGMLTRNILIQASPDAAQSLLRRPHHGDGHEPHVCRWRRAQSHGPAPGSGPLSDPLASGRRRRQGAVHQELVDPRHLQPLRDGAWHELRARREQRDLQHRRSLLLPRGRHRARQRVRAQPGDPDQVSSGPRPASRPTSPQPARAQLRQSPGRQDEWPAMPRTS